MARTNIAHRGAEVNRPRSPNRADHIDGLSWLIASKIARNFAWEMPPKAEAWYDRKKEEVWRAIRLLGEDGRPPWL
jgi:hypothetical protein